jgi:hypothetical protein
VFVIHFPILLQASRTEANQLELQWTGTYPRYQVQRRPLEQTRWTNVGEPTARRHATVPLSEPGGLYRVISVPPSEQPAE